MRKWRVLLLFSVLLSGTGGPVEAKDAPTASPPPYSTVGLEKYSGSGTCQIVGKALVPTKTFGPLIFAGQTIHLIPLMDYSVWYVKRLAELSENSTLRYPAELAQFNHDATSDSAGNFSFNNIYCGSYIVEMFTDYQSDSHSIENRTIYSTNDDYYPSSVTTQRIHTKLLREQDVAAAQGTFNRESEQLTSWPSGRRKSSAFE